MEHYDKYLECLKKYNDAMVFAICALKSTQNKYVCLLTTTHLMIMFRQPLTERFRMIYTSEMSPEALERLETNKMKSDLVETLKTLQVLVRASNKDKLEEIRPKILDLLIEMGG